MQPARAERAHTLSLTRSLTGTLGLTLTTHHSPSPSPSSGMLELRHKEILARIDILNQMSTQA